MGELSGMSELLGLGAILHPASFATLVARLVLDLAFAGTVIHGVYLRLFGKREHVFTCYAFNVVTLSLCLLLRRGPAELGFALTLFGVFGILRYRTEQIKSRDLTYLFIVIGLGIVNGVADANSSLVELLTANVVIVGLTAALQLGPNQRAEGSMPLYYDRVELLHPGREAALAADLATRTGLVVVRVDTERIDLLRDAADIIVHFRRERSV